MDIICLVPFGHTVKHKTWARFTKYPTTSYDYLTIMPELRLTYDGRLIYKTCYEGSKAFLRYDSLAKL